MARARQTSTGGEAPPVAVEPAVAEVELSAVDDSADAVAALDAVEDVQEQEDRQPPKRKSRSGPSGGHISKAEWRARAEAAEGRLAQEGAAVPVADAAESLKFPLELTVRAYFARMERKSGPHWHLPDDERDPLVNAWAMALAPWAPALGKAAPILAAVAVTAGVFRPRQAVDRALKEAAKTGGAHAETAHTAG